MTNRLALAALLLSACTTTSSSDTSPGQLTTFSRLGGGNAGTPTGWASFTGTADATGGLALTSGSGDLHATGTLTATGSAKLADLIGTLPIDAGPVAGIGCGDTSQISVDIDFTTAGAHHYAVELDCNEGELADLVGFVNTVASDVIAGSNDADVTVGP